MSTTMTMAKALNGALRDAMRRRRAGADVRRGRRTARRRLPDHRRLDRRVRRPALLRYAAGRGRHRRLRGGHGDGWIPAGRGDAVRRVRLSGASSRSPRTWRSSATVPVAGSALPMVIRIPYARRHRRRRAPLRLQRGLLRAHARTQGGHAGDRRGRVLAASGRDRRPRSGRLPGTEEALLVQAAMST